MPTAKQVPCSIYAGKPEEVFAELQYTVLYTDEYNEAAFVHFLRGVPSVHFKNSQKYTKILQWCNLVHAQT
jgi:hypothetical protein